VNNKRCAWEVACENVSGGGKGVLDFDDKCTVSEKRFNDFNDLSWNVEL